MESKETEPIVSIFGLVKEYRRLDYADKIMSEREIGSWDYADERRCPVDDEGRCTTIFLQDFSKPLTPLDTNLPRIPFTTDSITNKYRELVSRMLHASESGGVGGDACRLRRTLQAATYDAIAIESPGRRFQHLLGLVLAIDNHHLDSFVTRSWDPPAYDQAIFTDLGDALADLFNIDDDSGGEIEGVSLELREWCIDCCRHLEW